MIEVMFEVIRYFGLNNRPSSGVKLKLKEFRFFYIGKSINSDCEMKTRLK